MTIPHPRNRLLLADDHAALEWAGRLVDAARLLEPDPDFERSIKFSAKGIDYNRFLLGVDAHDLTLDDLEQVGRALNMPTGLLVQATEAFQSPSTLLLGFEQQSGHFIYKLYFEFWDQVVSQVHGDGDPHAPVLLNLGFKWNVTAPRQHVVTRYTCLPLLGVNRILKRITKVADAPSGKACTAIVTRAARKLARPTFVYTEAEEGSGRQSFDLNLYSADLEIGDIKEELAALLAAFALPPSSLDLLNPWRFRTLGHLSAGMARDGQPFVTVYFEDDLPARENAPED